MNDVIVAEGITKAFGRARALDGVNLRVPGGSIFGFLGPNGSGKTTTLRVLLGLVLADEGRANVLGASVPRLRGVRHRIGALVEGPGYVPYLSARANLERFLAARSIPRRQWSSLIDRALERVGLQAAAERKVGRFSLGMRQRLGLAQAILTDAELLILDEPTNGLDPAGMREVRRLLAALQGEGRTVVLSTHLLSEAEQLCTHVAFMSTGRVVRDGSISQLREGSSVLRWRVRGRPLQAIASLVPSVRTVAADAVEFDAQREEIPALVAALVARGIELEEVTTVLPSLEDLFLAEVGEGFDVR